MKSLPLLPRERERYYLDRARFKHPGYDDFFLTNEWGEYEIYGVYETPAGDPYRYELIEVVPHD